MKDRFKKGRRKGRVERWGQEKNEGQEGKNEERKKGAEERKE